jgi:hypothetical protein
MSTAESPHAVLKAQHRLHLWNLAAAFERRCQYQAAQRAGVTPNQIALITGDPVDRVLEVLSERTAGTATVTTPQPAEVELVDPLAWP